MLSSEAAGASDRHPMSSGMDSGGESSSKQVAQLFVFRPHAVLMSDGMTRGESLCCLSNNYAHVYGKEGNAHAPSPPTECMEHTHL